MFQRRDANTDAKSREVEKSKIIFLQGHYLFLQSNIYRARIGPFIFGELYDHVCIHR